MCCTKESTMKIFANKDKKKMNKPNIRHRRSLKHYKRKI